VASAVVAGGTAGAPSRRRRRQRRRRHDDVTFDRPSKERAAVKSCDAGSTIPRSSFQSIHGSNISEPSTGIRERRMTMNEQRSSLLRRHKRILSSRRLITGQQRRQSARLFPTSSTEPVSPTSLTSRHHQQSSASASFDFDGSERTMSTRITGEGTPLLNNVTPRRQSSSFDLPLGPYNESNKFDSMETAGSGIPSRVLWQHDQRQQQQLQPSSSSTIKSPQWSALSDQVRKGHFLVVERESDNSDGIVGRNHGTSEHTTSNKSIEVLRHEAIESFQRGSTFSPQMCVLAILLYMVGAVFMFRFFFEPQWTVIDSCYFAVSTFTTLGKLRR
jgi:hypothetical protein